MHQWVGAATIGLMLVGVALAGVLVMLEMSKTNAAEADPSFRGVKGYGVNYADLWGTPQAQAADMAIVNDLGADWTRLPAYWYQIQEGGATSYNWVLLDRLVNEAKANNKRVLMMVLTTPAWARASGVPSGDAGNKYPPANMATFGTFTGKLVERYGPQGVLDYEIWNEPNLSRFWMNTPSNPKPSIDRYAEMLQVAANAARAKNASVNIISAGLSPAANAGDGSTISPTTFLQGLYARGMKSYFDSVGFHPYSYPVLPSEEKEWNAWSIMSITSFNGGRITQPSLRSIMAANGDAGKKIWLTEFGAPTSGSPDGVTEAMQSQIYTDAIRLHKSYSWVGPIFFYTLKDYRAYGASNDREEYFGIIRSNGVKKPAFAAIKSAIADTTRPVVGGYNSSVAPGVWSGTVRLRPVVSDNVALARVEMLIDGKLVQTDATSPYEFAIDTSKYAAGNHTVIIRAHDTAGNRTDGLALAFSVAAPKGGNPVAGGGDIKTQDASKPVSGSASQQSAGGTQGGGEMQAPQSEANKPQTETVIPRVVAKPMTSALTKTLGVSEQQAQRLVLPLTVGIASIILPAVGYGVYRLVRVIRMRKAATHASPTDTLG